MFGHGEPVQVERWQAGGKNSLGQQSGAFDPPVTIPGVGIDVPTVSEPRDGATQNIRFDYRLYLPAGTSIGDRDRVTVRGHACTVEQAGEPLTNPFTGRMFPTEVLVRRVTR